MDLDFDLTNNRLQLLSEDELQLKYRSRENCRLRFSRQGTAELLPSGGGIALFLIHGGEVVAEVVSWTTPASTAGWYEGTLILHTDPLTTAFEDEATMEITSVLEIHRWASGDIETPHISDESLMAKIRRPEIEPEPSSPITLSGAEAWLTARAVRYDVEQTFTTEQKAALRTKMGIVNGVSDHGSLTGLGDDDHPHYLTEARGDARYLRATKSADRITFSDGTFIYLNAAP